MVNKSKTKRGEEGVEDFFFLSEKDISLCVLYFLVAIDGKKTKRRKEEKMNLNKRRETRKEANISKIGHTQKGQKIYN